MQEPRTTVMSARSVNPVRHGKLEERYALDGEFRISLRGLTQVTRNETNYHQPWEPAGRALPAHSAGHLVARPEQLAVNPLEREDSMCLNRVRWCVSFGIMLAVGCGSAPPPDPHANRMVYYDRETKKAVVYNVSREMPTLHPLTGRASLVPASYCSQCQKWFPSPPIEVRQRNPKAVICPKGHSLTQDGPWPEEKL